MVHALFLSLTQVEATMCALQRIRKYAFTRKTSHCIDIHCCIQSNERRMSRRCLRFIDCVLLLLTEFFLLSSLVHRFFSHQFFSYFNRHFTVCVYSTETYVVLWSPLKSSASGIESTSSPSHSHLQSYC